MLEEMLLRGRVKNSVMARFSCETEYWAMTYTICEMLLHTGLLHEFNISCLNSINLFCDNQCAIFIASNLVFHERIEKI